MIYKALNGLNPSYLSDLLLPYEPSRTLRSSGSGLLIIPKVQTKTHLFITMVFVSRTAFLKTWGQQRVLIFLKANLRPSFLIWLSIELYLFILSFFYFVNLCIFMYILFYSFFFITHLLCLFSYFTFNLLLLTSPVLLTKPFFFS